jgi:hypothetical protein
MVGLAYAFPYCSASTGVLGHPRLMLGRGCVGRGITEVTVGSWLSVGGQHHKLLLAGPERPQEMLRSLSHRTP